MTSMRMKIIFTLITLAVIVTNGAGTFAPSLSRTSTHKDLFHRSQTQISVDGLTTANRQDSEHIKETFGKLPLRFEVNQGQTDERVEFLARGAGYTLFVNAAESVIALPKGNEGSASATDNDQLVPGRVMMKLVNANACARSEGLEPMAGGVSYFLGDDPNRWQPNVATFAKVQYREVYPGVDLLYYGKDGQLEYDFKVAPGADFKPIALDFEGAEKIALDDNGDLLLHTAIGDLRHQRPFIYQEINGERREVDGGYTIRKDSQIGFSLGDYDKEYELIIDPVLTYATYFGGNADDLAEAITLDAAGNAYITGKTQSVNFSSGPISNQGGKDAFIMRIPPSGAGYQAVFFGGNATDVGTAIALDSFGNVIVGGETSSANFPRIGAFDNSYNGGDSDAFIVKFNADFSAFLYATYFGGDQSDDNVSLVLDAANNICISGRTDSTTLPLNNAAQPSLKGGSDGFIAKFNAAGNALLYSTYWGGSGSENKNDYSGLAIDKSGNLYFGGETLSGDFPTKNAYQTSKAISVFADAFVVKVNPNASGNASIIYSTCVGGVKDDLACDVAVDEAGNAYLTGYTNSDDFPKLNSINVVLNGTQDTFVVKLNATGSGIVYSSLFGGDSGDIGYGIQVNSANEAYVTGTASWSQKVNSMKPFNGGTNDAFIAKLNAAGNSLDFFTYIGGSNYEAGQAIAIDVTGNAYAAGFTKSNDFAKVNAIQGSFGGGEFDSFVARFETDTPVTTDPAIANVYVSGKKLIIEGLNFDLGAKLLVNGQRQKKVFNDEQTPTTRLIGNKAGVWIAPGQTVVVQVQNLNGKTTQEYLFTRAVQ